MSSSNDTPDKPEQESTASTEPAKERESQQTPEKATAGGASEHAADQADSASQTDEAESAPPAAAAQKAKSRGGGAFWIRLALVIVGVVVGAALVRYVFPPASSPVLSNDDGVVSLSKYESDIADLRRMIEQSDVADLRDEVQALKEQPASSAADAALDEDALEDFTARLEALENSTQTLGASIKEIEAKPLATLPNGVEISQESLDNMNDLAGDLSEELDGVAQHVLSLEGSLAEADQDLGNRIAALEQKVPSDLTGQLSQSVSRGDLAALAQSIEARLSALETSTAAQDARRAAAAIALANLARAAQSGGAFVNELEAVRILDAQNELVEELAVYAPRGVRPSAELVADFGVVAREALRAAGRGSGGWWSRLWANLQNLFLVRRRGPIEGSSVEAIVSRAEEAAQKGNLSGAVAELARLEGPAADAVADWQRSATARVTLDRLITELNTHLLATLAE